MMIWQADKPEFHEGCTQLYDKMALVLNNHVKKDQIPRVLNTLIAKTCMGQDEPKKFLKLMIDEIKDIMKFMREQNLQENLKEVSDDSIEV